jgi:predicted AAA+ superfamily ATPase
VVAHRFSKDIGRNAENAVAVELWRRGIKFHYWIEREREVDFVYLTDNGKAIAINVSYSDSVEGREMKGLQEFSTTVKGKVEQLLILTRNLNDRIELGKKNSIGVVPLWKWLLDL